MSVVVSLPHSLRSLVRSRAALHLEILHAGLASGDGGTEGCDAMPGQVQGAAELCVMLRPKEAAEAERIFSALAGGGAVEIPIEETFWALRFGKVVDRFGIPWLVNCEKPPA